MFYYVYQNGPLSHSPIYWRTGLESIKIQCASWVGILRTNKARVEDCYGNIGTLPQPGVIAICPDEGYAESITYEKMGRRAFINWFKWIAMVLWISHSHRVEVWRIYNNTNLLDRAQLKRLCGINGTDTLMSMEHSVPWSDLYSIGQRNRFSSP